MAADTGFARTNGASAPANKLPLVCIGRFLFSNLLKVRILPYNQAPCDQAVAIGTGVEPPSAGGTIVAPNRLRADSDLDRQPGPLSG